MYEIFAYSIINPTFVIDVVQQAVEIPSRFNQILDKTDGCHDLSSNKRYLSSGLNAGILTDSKIFYRSVPEIESIASVNLNEPPRRKRTQIDIKDTFATKEFVSFNARHEAPAERDELKVCRPSAKRPDTYVVK